MSGYMFPQYFAKLGSFYENEPLIHSPILSLCDSFIYFRGHVTKIFNDTPLVDIRSIL